MVKISASSQRSFWLLQISGWFFFLYLVIAQGLTAISYDLGVIMGTQESVEQITEIGTAFFYGFAFGDLVVYIPILATGLIGHMLGKRWASIPLAAAFGITIYWPIVCLAALVDVRGVEDWKVASELPFWIALPLITAWGIWGLAQVIKYNPAKQAE
ncbi:hypothetical protein ACFLQV_01575 [Calditrichota bacterium]